MPRPDVTDAQPVPVSFHMIAAELLLSGVRARASGVPLVSTPVVTGSFRGNTGDGIRMAQMAGAALWHMWLYHGPYGMRHADPAYPFGFYAKLLVLQALVASGGTLALALAVFAVMMSLIGAFYYLRVVKVMYFDVATQDAPIRADWDVRLVLGGNGALVLLLGLVPGGLMALCLDAVARSLAF